MVGNKDGTKIGLTFALDIDDLIAALIQQAGPARLFEAIKEIDAAVEDWDFTLGLADHFETLRREYEQDEKAQSGAETISIRPPR